MVYRTVIYTGEGTEALKTLMRRVEEIKQRKEEIIAFTIEAIG